MKNLFFTIILLISGSMVFAQTTDAGKPQVVKSGVISADETWSSANTYILDGRVYVEPGVTLTIEPGTVVKGLFTQDPTQAAVLVIQVGGYLIADGTATSPIIFTSSLDSVALGTDAEPFYASNFSGLWGGIAVLGNGCLNTVPDVQNIEGIGVTAADSARTVYGNTDGMGCDNTDSSGVMRYISLRHGGTPIQPNNELNGLSLGGVGSKTVMEYIEILYNDDDGIEIFGGDVAIKYAAVAFVGDDNFDIDQGAQVKGQFWLAVQSLGYATANRGGEWDGADDPLNGTPLMNTTVYNMTFLGADSSDEGTQALEIRANGAAKVYNSIFQTAERGIRLNRSYSAGTDAWRRYQNGDSEFANNLFFDTKGNTIADAFEVRNDTAGEEGMLEMDATNDGNMGMMMEVIATSAANDTNYIPTGDLTFAPAAGGPATTGTTTPAPNDGFFTNVSFKGAFEPGTTNWLVGWSGLWSLGYMDQNAGLTFGVPTDIDAGWDRLEGVEVFPNPATSIVTVQAPELTNGELVAIYLLDVNGRTVLRQAAMPVAGQINADLNVANLNAGVYFVKLVHTNKQSVQKLVIK